MHVHFDMCLNVHILIIQALFTIYYNFKLETMQYTLICFVKYFKLQWAYADAAEGVDAYVALFVGN